MRLRILAPLLLSFAAACAGNDDVAQQQTDTGPGVRPEGPGTPGFDGGTPDDDPDMGEVTPPDAAGCPVGACRIDEVRCQGAGVQTCAADDVNPACGTWGDIVDCDGPGEACIDGACEVPTGCVDNDGDDHGVQCAAGNDCNDADRNTYDGAFEACDGFDNDCDGDIDEGFQLGTPCTVGGGSCQASGFLACGPDGGGTVCNAQMPTGSPEECDGLDNDCNGLVDDGVCTLCNADPNEPNDTLAQATTLNVDAPIIGSVCATDSDFFSYAGVTPGVQYRVHIAFPEALADLQIQAYDNGQAGNLFDSSGDYVRIGFLADPTYTYGLEVINKDPMAEGFYRVALVEESSLRCAGEDGFAPNQEYQDSFPIIPGWAIQAEMCPSSGGAQNRVSDWWDLGEIQAGETVEADMQQDDIFMDLDIQLYVNDGSGWIVEKTSAGFGDYERIQTNASITGRRLLEVRDWDGSGGPYTLLVDIN